MAQQVAQQNVPAVSRAPAPAAVEHHVEHLGHHFETLEQQHHANTLAMWAFLITEILLFGGLFCAYFYYFGAYRDTWMEASRYQNVLLGMINTNVLILSSLFVAVSIWSVQKRKIRTAQILLSLTIVCGFIFLVIKGIEYYGHFTEGLVPGPHFVWEGPQVMERPAQLFFWLYWIMTGLHALHMVIGIAIIAFILYKVTKRTYSPEYFTPAELGGLYWHLIDIIWVFLFPMLYLIGGHYPT
ncbi:MAG: cytochrome c oxidase subunit 3 [Anaerolineae bacterium]